MCHRRPLSGSRKRARNVDHILTGTLLPEMSTTFLARMAKGEAIATVHVSVAEAGDFVYHIA